jgi:hypothetical protein
VALLWATPAFAQSWGRGGKPSMSDLKPTVSDSEAYSDRYGFSADMEDGTHVGVDFTISNLGFGDRNVVVEVRVKPKNGKDYRYNESYDEDEWSAGSSGFSLKAGPTTIQGKGKDTFIINHAGSTPVKLKFENIVPMWSPGSGRLSTDAGFYDIHIISPVARVTGTVGGRKVTSSQGYAEHVATDAAPYELARSFRRARIYKDDIMILWRDIELHPDIGGGNTPWILVTYKDKIVFSSSKARVRYGSTYKDSKSGYVVPKAVQIDARNGKDRIKLIMKARRTKRKDLLANQGSFVKAVASAVAEPYQFTGTGEFTLQMEIGGAAAQVGDNAHYTIDFITK